MNKIDGFVRSLEVATVRQFLLATPFASGEKSLLDIELDQDIFYDKLYCSSQYANEVCDEIKARSEKGNTKNIIISGYKGCGKTTFINYFARRSSARSIMLNFDSYVDRGSGNEIKTIILLDVFRKITDNILFGSSKICNKMLDIYNRNHNKRFFSRFVDPKNSFKNLFATIYTAIFDTAEKDLDDFFDDKLKNEMNVLEVYQLLIVVILYDISSRLVENKISKCYLIFDNLDVIDNTIELEEFTKDISAFINNASYILDNISYEGLAEEGYNAFQDYTIVFCMRETTKAEFIEHFTDRGMQIYIPDNVSSMFDKEKIVCRRYEFLFGLKKNDVSGLLDDVQLIKELLNDTYVKDVLFKLFNYDYRTSINVLAEVEYNNKKGLAESTSMKKYQSVCAIYGSRCILLRKIFEIFRNNHYFEKIKESEYSVVTDDNLNMAINITRIILLYLRNSQTLYLANEKIDNQTISLYEVFDDLSKICDDSTVIVNSIWNMYELRNQSFWNHLITFDGMRRISLSELEEQMRKYKGGEKNYRNYGRIRITSAGHAYLENLIIHFEYFSTRLKYVDKSLFSFSAMELQNLEQVESVCSGVYNEVEKCIQKVALFYKVVFEKKNSYNEDDFLGSKFAWHKMQGNKGKVSSMFHAERIIHSHIGYLDSLRKYAFLILENDDDKRKISKLIIRYIIKYIYLFNIKSKSAMLSGTTRVLVEQYEKCIQIITQKDFWDFETNIDRETGRKLLELEE